MYVNISTEVIPLSCNVIYFKLFEADMAIGIEDNLYLTFYMIKFIPKDNFSSLSKKVYVL